MRWAVIRKNNSNYKIWKRRNDKKKLRNRLRSKKKSYINNNNRKKDKELPRYKTFYIPKIFSIIKNPEETIQFLNNLINHVERVRKTLKSKLKDNNFKITFSLNMDNTIEITGDALMYLLTIIRNTRESKSLPVDWIGNFPKNEKMKKFLQNSGYLKYMKTARKNLVTTNEHIQIQIGQGYEYRKGENLIDIRQEIIDFTCQKLNKNKIQVNFLMTMLTEMITNIKDHAYEDDNLFIHNWYIFVENDKNKISYTFMDNGLGIPTTIKKNKLEKIIGKFYLDKEYKYIEAGVSGIEKRSKTGLIERGNGLPSIYEQYLNKKINKLIIISNKAYYTKEHPKDLKNSLNGTIFYWEIEKEEST